MSESDKLINSMIYTNSSKKYELNPFAKDFVPNNLTLKKSVKVTMINDNDSDIFSNFESDFVKYNSWIFE